MGGKRYTVAILILCILGLLASIYAYHVETSKERDSTYQAACDISEKISCSKVFTSRWGRGFGLVEYVTGKDHVLNQPNSVFGAIFFVLQLVFSIQNSVLASSLALLLSTVGIFGCAYLGYILYFILEDFCIVCVTTYVINFLLLIVTYFRRKYVLRLIHKKNSKKVR